MSRQEKQLTDFLIKFNKPFLKKVDMRLRDRYIWRDHFHGKCGNPLSRRPISLISKNGEILTNNCLTCLVKKAFLRKRHIKTAKYIVMQSGTLERNIEDVLLFVQNWVLFEDQRADLTYFLEKILHSHFVWKKSKITLDYLTKTY